MGNEKQSSSFTTLSHTHIHTHPVHTQIQKKSIEKQKRLVWCVSTTKPHYNAWANSSLLWKQRLTVKQEPKQFRKISSLAVWKNAVATKRLPGTVTGKTLFTASKIGWSGEGVPSDRGHCIFFTKSGLKAHHWLTFLPLSFSLSKLNLLYNPMYLYT